MPRSTASHGSPGLVERLEARRPELEKATLTRVYGVSDPGLVDDPGYALGLRSAVAAALEYGIAAVAQLERPSIPPQLIAQARYAARSGTGLDTVLRRYFAGYSLLTDVIVEEAGGARGPQDRSLQRVLRAEAGSLDRLLAVISREYREESEGKLRGVDQRRVEHVKALLAGELVDVGELGYELDAWHLGVIATGPQARSAIGDLAAVLECRLLMVSPEPGVVWAWLGRRSRFAASEALRLGSPNWPAESFLALGEAGRGVDGWRLAHRQAKAAMPIALRGAPRLVCYAEVALLASALADDVLAGSLRNLYLAPLERECDGGIALRQTLRAYLAAGHNVSSAAAALGVSRQTVNRRLRKAEESIGCHLHVCAAEIETALRLAELDFH